LGWSYLPTLCGSLIITHSATPSVNRLDSKCMGKKFVNRNGKTNLTLST
jgi:hypothetical protein